MSNNSNTVIGILAGAAVGATLGILFAPDKGANTRQRIADEAQAAKDRLVNGAHNLKDRVAETVSNKRHSLDDQIENIVSDASYKAEDVISTLEKKLADLKEKNKKFQKA